MDPPSCMICMSDEGVLYRSPCRCAGVLVHLACFEKMIQRPNYGHACAVCQAPYGAAVQVRWCDTVHRLTSHEFATVALLHSVVAVEMGIVVHMSFATDTSAHRGAVSALCLLLWLPVFAWTCYSVLTRRRVLVADASHMAVA